MSHAYAYPEDSPQAQPPLARLMEEQAELGAACSHALRDPARMMTILATTLMNQGQHHPQLKEIANLSSQIEMKLAAMTDYLRLECDPSTFKTIHGDDLVVAAIEKTAETHPRIAAANMHYHGLPHIKGNRRKLIRLFYCLLDNACKFNRHEAPEIFISALRKGPMWEFRVEDNGIGIPKEFHEVIFMLLQRLNETAGYPGIGAGLPIARKIARLHGGDMWCEHGAAGNTRICFTLPTA